MGMIGTRRSRPCFFCCVVNYHSVRVIAEIVQLADTISKSAIAYLQR